MRFLGQLLAKLSKEVTYICIFGTLISVTALMRVFTEKSRFSRQYFGPV